MTDKPMTQGERNELRRIIKGDFSTLRAELEQRREELVSDIEHRVAQRFEPSEEAVRACRAAVAEAVEAANQAIESAVDAAMQTADGYRAEWMPLVAPRVQWNAVKREELRRALHADVAAKVGAARVTLQRQEVELQKRLSMDALTSGSARAFLESIPKVADLVPAARMAELEAAWEEPDAER